MKLTSPVVGLACSACSANVERKLNSLDGVTSASVSLPGRSALVDFNADVISPEQMKKAINDIGYDRSIDTNEAVEEIEKRALSQLRRKTVFSLLL